MKILDIKTAKGDKIISSIEILYLEAKNKHTLIYLTDLTYIESHHLIKWFDDILLKPDFFRCHNSFIVNCLYIDFWCNNRIFLKKSITHIPISRQKKHYFKENFEQYKQKLYFQSLQNTANYFKIELITP